MPAPDQHANPTAPPSLKASTISGTAWSLGAVVAAKVASLITQIVLARILLPSDFGMAAIAIGITSLLFVTNPIIAGDLAIQRSDRLTKVLARCQRLGLLAGLVVFSAILITAFIAPRNSGHPIAPVSGATLQETTPLESIKAGESALPILHSQGVEFAIDSPDRTKDFVSIEADANLSPTVGVVVDYLNAGIAEVDPSGVRLKIEAEGILVVPGAAGINATLEPRNSSTEMLFDTLGIPFYSTTMFLLLLAMSIRPITVAMRIKPMVILRVELCFRAISIFSFCSTLLGSGLAITLALLGAGPLAVIASLVSMPVFQLIFVSLGALRYRGKYRSDPDPKEPLLGDFFTLAGAQWIHSLAFSIGYVVLAFSMNDAMVGIYYFAFVLSLQINALIGSSLAGPLLPIFASIKDEPARFDNAFLRVAGMLTLVSIPACFFLAIVAPWLIPLVFGAKWVVAVNLVILLFIAQGVAITNTASISALKATGRFKTWGIWQTMLTLSIVAAAIFAGVFQSILLMAALVLLVYVVCGPLCVALALQSGNVLRAWRVHLIPVVCASPVLLGLFIYNFSDDLWVNVGGTTVWGCVCLVGYIVLMRILVPEQAAEITRFLHKTLGKLRGSGSVNSA
jgi:O-antigen/teichoic acid export membrane protein